MRSLELTVGGAHVGFHDLWVVRNFFVGPLSQHCVARSSSCDRVRSLRQKWNEVPSLRCRPRRTFSISVRWGNTAEIWNERMTPRRAICAGCSRVMSCPLNRMVPEVGVRNLVSRLKHVVLPAPLGPISAWMEPRRTARFTSLTAVKPLNSLVRLWVSRMTSLIAPGSLRWVLGKEALASKVLIHAL